MGNTEALLRAVAAHHCIVLLSLCVCSVSGVVVLCCASCSAVSMSVGVFCTLIRQGCNAYSSPKQSIRRSQMQGGCRARIQGGRQNTKNVLLEVGVTATPMQLIFLLSKGNYNVRSAGLCSKHY